MHGMNMYLYSFPCYKLPFRKSVQLSLNQISIELTYISRTSWLNLPIYLGFRRE